jgi:hypothetical protein
LAGVPPEVRSRFFIPNRFAIGFIGFFRLLHVVKKVVSISYRS